MRFSLSVATPAVISCGGSSVCAVASTGPIPPTSSDVCSNGVVEYRLNGSVESCGADEKGVLPSARCASLCPLSGDASAMSCRMSVVGPRTLECTYYGCVVGRRTHGLQRAAWSHGTTPVGQLLAQLAYLEAASVHAFRLLARELEAHRAPAHLRAKARRAARDEVQHARVMRQAPVCGIWSNCKQARRDGIPIH